jgi:hypothetical protein
MAIFTHRPFCRFFIALAYYINIASINGIIAILRFVFIKMKDCTYYADEVTI